MVNKYYNEVCSSGIGSIPCSMPLLEDHMEGVDLCSEALQAAINRAHSRSAIDLGLFLLGSSSRVILHGLAIFEQQQCETHVHPQDTTVSASVQCTLINFIATERGLEDQLLAKVVGVERPELEKQAQELQAAFNQASRAPRKGSQKP